MIATTDFTIWKAFQKPEELPSVVIRDPSLPLVSIVTPSYNQGCFIRETIESVLAQDYPNLEYWVMDGGSSDDTISILKEYEHDLRFHWVSEPDHGQSNAINKGWSRCRGDILAWLNSDDTYLPGAVKHQVEALLTHKQFGVVYGDSIFIDKNGNYLSKWHSAPYNVLDLLRTSLPPQPTVFIYRHICEKIGMLNESYQFSMDTEYWVRAAKVTDFWYEPKFIATYRLHQQSKTVGSYSGFYQDWLQIANNYFADPNLSDRMKQQKYQVLASIYSRIASMEAESGSLIEMFKYLQKSVLAGGIRLRLFKSLLLLAERLLPFRFMPKMLEVWTYLKARTRQAISDFDVFQQCLLGTK
jgi:glycosyltransferase involved in cell wall biosynthesis